METAKGSVEKVNNRSDREHPCLVQKIYLTAGGGEKEEIKIENVE